MEGETSIVGILLDNGAIVNARNVEGETVPENSKS
jgi:hypothetical protein